MFSKNTRFSAVFIINRYYPEDAFLSFELSQPEPNKGIKSNLDINALIEFAEQFGKPGKYEQGLILDFNPKLRLPVMKDPADELKFRRNLVNCAMENKRFSNETEQERENRRAKVEDYFFGFGAKHWDGYGYESYEAINSNPVRDYLGSWRYATLPEIKKYIEFIT